MENYNMEILKMEISNITKNSIITSLYKRDLIKNYFPQDQILNYLKQLNYYNIDIGKETKIYLINKLNELISNELNTNFHSDIKNKTIEEQIAFIKESNEYKNFIVSLNNKIQRAFALSKHIVDCNNVLNFYNDLTLEELQQLKY